MAEELPRFVYLHAACCKSWLAVFDLPSRAEPKLTKAAPSRGWVQQDDGSWLCDEHARKGGKPAAP